MISPNESLILTSVCYFARHSLVTLLVLKDTQPRHEVFEVFE